MTSRNLILSLAALTIFTFPTGAPAKEKPAPAKAEKSAGANADAYVALMEKMFQNMTDTAEAVTDVSTEDEIGAAIEALETSTKEIQSIQKQLKKMGVPSAKVKAEIDTHTELGPKGQEAGKGLQEAMKTIPQDSPEFGTALQAYGTALTELGNDLNALEAEASGKRLLPSNLAPARRKTTSACSMPCWMCRIVLQTFSTKLPTKPPPRLPFAKSRDSLPRQRRS